MRHALVMLGALLCCGCSEVLDADDYRFDQACDGTPGYVVPDDRTLLLEDTRALGFTDQEDGHTFSAACVREQAQVRMCGSFMRINATRESASQVIGGGGIESASGGSGMGVIISAGFSPLVHVTINVPENALNAFLDIDAPDRARITLRGGGFLSVFVESEEIEIDADGTVELIGFDPDPLIHLRNAESSVQPPPMDDFPFNPITAAEPLEIPLCDVTFDP